MVDFPITKFYTTTERMLQVFDKQARKLKFQATNQDEYAQWQAKVREKLWEVLGMNQMEGCDLSPTLLESTIINHVRRDKMLIQTEPDVWMPMYVFVPTDISKGEKRPSFIVPHGHMAGKYVTAQVLNSPHFKDRLDRVRRLDIALRLAEAGFITFCPDARGAGERREWMKQSDSEADFLGSTCTEINHMAISLGQSIAGMMTWDLMRLGDYIESRDDCDPERIGCGGMSGGGMQTLYLSALDDRIGCSVISGYFYGVKESLLKLPHNCGCNFVPGLWKHVDMGDLGALIAPRYLYIESGSNDHLNGENGIANVYPQVDTVRAAFRLFDADNRVRHYVFEGKHEWNGEPAYPFIAGWNAANGGRELQNLADE